MGMMRYFENIRLSASNFNVKTLATYNAQKELKGEGIAHRGNFDLTQHQEFSGQKLDYTMIKQKIDVICHMLLSLQRA